MAKIINSKVFVESDRFVAYNICNMPATPLASGRRETLVGLFFAYKGVI